MKQIELNIQILCKTEAELDPAELELLDRAKRATYRSYAPYSHFSVGAAVLLSDGTIVEGSNQEVAAYPQGLCAERTALFHASSQHPELTMECICVAARGTDGQFTAQPVTPCGACRDVISEMTHKQGKPMKVILYGTNGIYIIEDSSALLPLTFSL